MGLIKPGTQSPVMDYLEQMPLGEWENEIGTTRKVIEKD